MTSQAQNPMEPANVHGEASIGSAAASLGEPSLSLGPLDDLLSLESSQESTLLSPWGTPNNNSNNAYAPAYHNAVHMELQENAKLPIFTLPVDRSNSSNVQQHVRTHSFSKLSPATSHDMEELIRLAEKDDNLTEMFLKSHDRSSINMNWSSAGALLSHIGDWVDVDDNNSCSVARRDSVTSSGSQQHGSSSIPYHSTPVPRSVHIPNYEHSTTNGTTNVPMAQAPSAGFGANSPPGMMPFASPTCAQYLYHRPLPLPIPKRLSPETTNTQPASTSTEQAKVAESTDDNDDVMTAALATAAAIVTARSSQSSAPGVPLQTTTTRTATYETSKSSPSQPSMLPPLTFPSYTVESTLHPPSDSMGQGKSQQVPAPNSQQPLAPAAAPPSHPSPSKSHPPPFRAAHPGAPSGSIEAATKQRSQFGFGGNHVVPSVPLPPPQHRRRAAATAAAPAVPESAGVAYERKKQRAKDSRVKLNESIERLAIAIGLTGTQSKQRSDQLQSIPPPVGLQGFRSNTVHILEECGRIATDAKKWDRPSFVGSAAALIQSLNAQCEALMTEMMEMKRRAGEMNANGETTARVSPSFLQNGDSNDNGSCSHVTFTSPKRKDLDITENGNKNGVVNAKRQRLEEGENGTRVAHDDAPLGIDSILAAKPTMQTLLSMLDSRSLIRCAQVSKNWAEIYENDQVWLHRSADRFGYYNVRQWKEKMQDDHLPTCSSIELYRNMDSGNVRPYCKLEGSLVLGEARMPCKVSAWASMVERSNGETIRSVVLESDKRTYSSLPVVELRLLIQNTGLVDYPIVLKEQMITVDASTRRRGEEMKEITWDDRFQKIVLNLDGTPRAPVEPSESHDLVGELCRLKLYEAVVLVVHIHARGCSTTSKFQHKSNFTKVLVTLNGTTVPLVIPFFRDSNVS